MAGCYLAQRLSRRTQVTVFEKSRGASGRLATRRHEEFVFDHGAQFFTARSQQFLEYLTPYLANGSVQGWNPRLMTLGGPRPYKRQWFEPHFVAVPTMAAWLKHMAESLDVRSQQPIVSSCYQDGQWFLHDAHDNRHGPYEWVICTAPAPQTAALFPALTERLSRVRMTGCWALLMGFDKAPGPLNWDAAVVHNSPLSWLAWNQTRPGRSGPPALVAHSSNDWAEEHEHWTKDEVEIGLGTALRECCGIDPGQARFCQVHRWRYAATRVDLGAPYLADFQCSLAAAGDWCLQGRLEGAFLSAHQLSEYLLSA